MRLRIGTRGSALALAQSTDVAARLRALGHDPELVVISTVGDRVTDRAFTDVGSFGVFVRELESALLEGAIDAAVHSYKDVPSRMPQGLVIAAVPERVDVADVLLVRRDAVAAERGGLPLADGARVGTSATRRRALLLDARPDLVLGLCAAMCPRAFAPFPRDDSTPSYSPRPASPGSHGRMASIASRSATTSTVRLDPAVFVPAPSQGAIAVQVRESDLAVRAAVAPLDDQSCRRAIQAERAALYLAEGGCTLPFGAWCSVASDGTLTLVAALGLEDGSVARSVAVGEDPQAVASVAWDELSRGVHA